MHLSCFFVLQRGGWGSDLLGRGASGAGWRAAGRGWGKEGQVGATSCNVGEVCLGARRGEEWLGGATVGDERRGGDDGQ